MWEDSEWFSSVENSYPRDRKKRTSSAVQIDKQNVRKFDNVQSGKMEDASGLFFVSKPSAKIAVESTKLQGGKEVGFKERYDL